MIKFKIFLIVFVFIASSLFAQTDTINIWLRFSAGDQNLDLSIDENLENINSLEQILQQDSLKQISSIEINTNISPDDEQGSVLYLSFCRAENIKLCLMERLSIAEDKIKCRSGGVDRAKYMDLVRVYDVPFKDEAVGLIVSSEQNHTRLKNLRNGVPYNYIKEHIYPFLRSVSVVSVITRREPPRVLVVSPEPFCVGEPYEEPVNRLECGLMPYHYPSGLEQVQITQIQRQAQGQKIKVKPLFALKTNLLFDIATFINLAIEIPLRRQWSIEAEFIFPWWRDRANDFTLQTRAAHLALNYWLGDRASMKVLTGWSVGVVGGYGLYDFQFFDSKGVQGRFFDVGFSCGYAHAIGRSLRLEYKLALGYLNSNYEKYSQVDQTKYGDIKVVDYPWEQKRKHWIGPTQLRVSLVWMINSFKKGGER